MDIKFYKTGLFLLYILTVINNTYLLRFSEFKNIFLVITLITLFAFTGLLCFKGRLFINFTLKKNVLFFLYFTSLFLVQFFFHGIGIYDILEIVIYFFSGAACYIIIPYFFLQKPDLLEFWMKILFYSSGLLASTAIISNLGVDNLFGLPFLNKYGRYSIMGIHATGGILQNPYALGCQSLLGIGAGIYIYFLLHNKWRGLFLPFLFLNIIGLVVAFARGPWVAAGFGAFFYLLAFTRFSFFKLALLLCGSVFFLLIIFINTDVITENNLITDILRLEQGSSGRVDLWSVAAELIKQEPLMGYGLSSQSELKQDFAAFRYYKENSASGFHNTFINSSLESGLLVGGLYLSLFLFPASRLFFPGYSYNLLLKKALVFIVFSMFVASLFVTFNIGGLRSTAFAFTIFLGIANLNSYQQFTSKNRSSHNKPQRPFSLNRRQLSFNQRERL